MKCLSLFSLSVLLFSCANFRGGEFFHKPKNIPYVKTYNFFENGIYESYTTFERVQKTIAEKGRWRKIGGRIEVTIDSLYNKYSNKMDTVSTTLVLKRRFFDYSKLVSKVRINEVLYTTILEPVK